MTKHLRGDGIQVRTAFPVLKISETGIFNNVAYKGGHAGSKKLSSRNTVFIFLPSPYPRENALNFLGGPFPTVAIKATVAKSQETGELEDGGKGLLYLEKAFPLCMRQSTPLLHGSYRADGAHSFRLRRGGR